MKRQVGFIGLGIMGKPMATNLTRAGVDLLVSDIDGSAVKLLEQRGATGVLPLEIAAQSRILFTMLPNGSVVEQVLFGENGIVSHLEKGTLVCDMSSTGLVEATSFHKRLAERGVGFLDAPVSGGEPKAEAGSLTFMVGGAAGHYETAVPFFEIMGSISTLVGGPGSGCVAKLCNQIITTMNIAAIAEAYALADRSGVDLESLFAAIRSGSAASAMLESKTPKILERDFAPGGRILTHLKDLRNVKKTAAELELPLPLTEKLADILQEHRDNGFGELDSSSLLQHYRPEY